MPKLQAVDSALFFSRQDPADPRLGELHRPSAEDAAVSILGYPDDEGIQLNGGRVGAALGPAEIRRWLYRMTPHPRREPATFHDLGDVPVEAGPLATRHELGRETVRHALKQERRVLALGGGNDYAYADGRAFLDVYGERRPLVINVDAHLDVRDSARSLNSGTPFFRMLESGVPFDFVEFGIQTHCNARAHWDYVLAKGGRIVTLEEMREAGLSALDYATQTLGELWLKRRPTFLAIDRDAFAWAHAQGTSAAWPLGLAPDEFFPLFALWLKRLDVRVLGLYETSPPLDPGGGTARLAAQLAHGFLHV